MSTRLWAMLASLAGLGLALWIVVHEGLRDIFDILDSAGWILLWLIPLHAISIALDACGWHKLLRPFDPRHHASLPFLSWIATVREAVNRLLPVANIGGELVGIRLALLRPLHGAAVTASVLVEVLLSVVSQYLFTAAGLILLIALIHDAPVTHDMLIGLVATLPVPVVLYFLLRNGKVFGRIRAGFMRTFGADQRLSIRLAETSTRLDEDLRRLLGMPGPLSQALLLQLASMAFGAIETWVALLMLGHPISLGSAFALESLSLAVRNFIFFVPAGIGVQEAGYVFFGNLVGLPADVAVALSLVRRLRDIGFGLPALLSWPWIEGCSLGTRVAACATDSAGP